MLQLSVIIFRNEEGKILLQYRDSGPPMDPLSWSLFGGSVEAGETPTEGVLREMKEELGLELLPTDVRLLSETVRTLPDGRHQTVYFFEGVQPLVWGMFLIHEGAGAAFLTKDEIAKMASVTDLARTLVAAHG